MIAGIGNVTILGTSCNLLTFVDVFEVVLSAAVLVIVCDFLDA